MDQISDSKIRIWLLDLLIATNKNPDETSRWAAFPPHCPAYPQIFSHVGAARVGLFGLCVKHLGLPAQVLRLLHQRLQPLSTLQNTFDCFVLRESGRFNDIVMLEYVNLCISLFCIPWGISGYERYTFYLLRCVGFKMWNPDSQNDVVDKVTGFMVTSWKTIKKNTR